MKLRGTVLGMIAGRVAEDHQDDEVYISNLLDEFAAIYAKLPAHEREALNGVFNVFSHAISDGRTIADILSARECEKLDALHKV
jgi:hypothetical protein